MTDLRDQLQTGFAGVYAIERELGGGGMSRVFVATEHALGRKVVLKALPSNIGIDMSAERFAREIALAAGLQHACIVPVLAAGVSHGVPFYTMPYVEGQTLRDRLVERKRLPVDEAVSVLRDVASALGAAHARGIVHRDIKPENILLSGGYAQVTDFGIARAISQSRAPAQRAGGQLTEAGLAIGTPAYMAPEQVAGDDAMDQRVDIYAVGCLAYELVTGAPPFTGRPPHLLLSAQVSEQPVDVRTRRADLPANLGALIMRCLEKDAAKRPQSADDLLDFLRAPLQAPRAAGAPERSVQPQTRARVPAWAWYLTFTTAVAAIGVAIFAVWPRAREPKSVAVLPFSNVGGDTSQEYFSDGITDDLISALAEIPGLRVAPRTSAFALKGKPIDARDVGRQLDVADLLEGSVKRTGAGLRVNAMLIRTRDGVSTWSKTFDRSAADLFTVQDDITRAIARELRIKLHPGADSLGTSAYAAAARARAGAAWRGALGSAVRARSPPSARSLQAGRGGGFTVCSSVRRHRDGVHEARRCISAAARRARRGRRCRETRALTRLDSGRGACAARHGSARVPRRLDRRESGARFDAAARAVVGRRPRKPRRLRDGDASAPPRARSCAARGVS